MHLAKVLSSAPLAMRLFTSVAIVATMFFAVLLLEEYVSSKELKNKQLRNALVDPILTYKDPSKTVDINEAFALQRAGAFEPATASSGLVTRQDVSLWFYASFTNEEPYDVELIFDTKLHVVPSGEIYVYQKEQMMPALIENADSLASSRLVSPRRFAISLNAAPGEKVEIFFRYDPKVYHNPRLRLVSFSTLVDMELSERSQHLLLFGFCTALAIAGLAICFALRFSPAALYSGFILSMMSYSVVGGGYAYEFIPTWPNATHNYAIRIIISLTCAFGALFVSGIFNFKEVAPRLYFISRIWVVLCIGAMLTTLTPEYTQLEFFTFLFMAISAEGYFAVACVGVYFGWVGARLLLFGSSFLAILGILALHKVFGEPWTTGEAYATIWRLGMLIEAFVFMLIIVLRISEIRRTEEAATSRSVKLMKSEIALNKALRDAEVAAQIRQRDIAEKDRIANARIEDLKNDLEYIGRVNLMGQFAAGLAHELNQPLSALVHDVDSAKLLIKDGDAKSAEMRSILEDIENHTFRAGDIIRALRSMVQKRTQSREPFDIGSLAEQTIAIIKKEADEKRITLEVEINQELYVVADRVQVAQVMVNLLRNAVEALGRTEDANRRICVSAIGDGPKVFIAVQDNGPGMPSGFAPFAQFGAHSTNGMGLGLSICKSLVDANDGSISIDNTYTKGARFEITLPGVP